MTESEFSDLKKKIEAKKMESAQARGKMESIEETWKSKWGVSGVDEAEKKLAEMKDKAAKIKAKRDECFESLKAVCDWS